MKVFFYYLESVKSMKSNDSVTTNTSNEKGSLSMDEILQREMEGNFQRINFKI